MITDDTNPSVIESYKAVRANINFAVPNEGCKKIMICSSYSGEGKTTTCVNLAISIAQTGLRVLLIDCDLRKSRIHEFFDLDNENGLSNYLSNVLELDECLKATHIENLCVIPAGTTPPNPAELLMSPKFIKIFEIFENTFDYIIIDTAPICVVSDALPLSKLCDGVILVAQHLETTHPHIRECLNKLNFAQAKVAGIILNGVDIKYKNKYYGKYVKYNNNSKYK